MPELAAVSVGPSGLTVGASVSLKRLVELCHEQDPASPLFSNDPAKEAVRTATSSYAALARHVLKVAGQQVSGPPCTVCPAGCGCGCGCAGCAGCAGVCREEKAWCMYMPAHGVAFDPAQAPIVGTQRNASPAACCPTGFVLRHLCALPWVRYGLWAPGQATLCWPPISTTSPATSRW